MKKITLLLLVTLCSFIGYSQFPQNFESASVSVPSGFPAGWLVTDNGVGSAVWEITNVPSLVVNGAKSASIDTQEIGMGTTSEDWLISPLVSIPSNGQLQFNTKQALAGDNGTVYQIRVSTSATPTNLNSYSVLQQWTEAELNQVFNLAEQKTVNFPSTYFGANVHLAFVRVYTQSAATIGGDRWIIDDINVVQECLPALGLGASGITSTTATLSWNGLQGATEYDVVVLPADEPFTFSATMAAFSTNFIVTGLAPSTCYKFYVRSNCGNSNFSAWAGPFNFCSLPVGFTCEGSIGIPTLPYQSTKNTADFGNTLSGPQSASCVSGGVNYLAGNDVFYNYTATENCNVNFTLNSNQPGSSLFIYPTCTNFAGSCLAAAGDATSATRTINYNVTAGTSYIIVVSSSVQSPTVEYSLLIQCENCAEKPTNLAASNLTAISADLSWTAPSGSVLSYQIVVQPEGALIPSGAGVTTGSSNPNFLATNLNSEIGYQYWVRAECAPGVFSGWAGPLLFFQQSCPKPLNSGMSIVTATTANLSWLEAGAAAQWEVFITTGTAVPVNNTTLNTGVPGYFLAATNTNFTVNAPPPMVSYSYYVRAICSSTDLSDWTKINVVDKIVLTAFIDANNNGMKEATESNFPHGNYTFVQNNNGLTNFISAQSGSYTLLDPNPLNTYNFNFEIDSDLVSYYAETPTGFSAISIQAGSGTQTLYFPITITQVYDDVQIFITPLDNPRPGFAFTHKITYKNVGHNPLSGTITYTKDNSNVSILSLSVPVTATLLNGFIYNFSNLLPGEVRNIFVNMLVATIPTVNLGDVLTHTASITSSATDVNLTNNSNTVAQTVVGSYDPNDKNEARGANVPIGQFSANDYLFYTIRFQNSGTASAEKVRIEDSLESEFNFASIQMVSASHSYVMQRINNKIIWTFNNINLPSENQDEPGSHGYVTFKIKLNPGFAVGDVIENTAEIYFDFNPPIITNTFQTTFVPNLSTSTFDGTSLIVYPNPAKEMVQISWRHATETMSKVVIFDMIGKTIKTVSGNNMPSARIDVGRLAAGMYLIEISTTSNLKVTRKLMVH